MAEDALCLHCGNPIVCHGDVWRHMAKTHDGKPMLTRWCLQLGWYVWPTQHAYPAS